MAEEGKAATRRFIDLAWNQGKYELARPMLHPDFVNHAPIGDETRDQFLARIQSMRAAFPDWRLEVEQMLSDGEFVITRWSARGTHKGTFRDRAATGRVVRVTGIAIDHVVNGVRVQGWSQMDNAGLLRQLDAAVAEQRA